MSALSQASQRFERAGTPSLGNPRFRSAGVALVVLALAVVDALLLIDRRFSFALLFASLPLVLLLFGRTRAVFLGVLTPALVATLVFGHTFASIKVGPMYALDAVLLAVLFLAAPAIVSAVGRSTGIAAVIALLLLITMIHVYEAGFSRVVLRQSVLGFYALWVFVGMAVARSGVLERYMRFVYWGAAGATILLATSALHDVAHDLYIGYGVLIGLFTPRVLARRHLAYPILVAQMALLALGQVRSIWVALPLAVFGTLVVCGRSRSFMPQLLRLLAIAALLFGLAVAARPSIVGSLKRQANSIFNYSGSTTSDNNAKWRLSNWNYGISQISAHPLGGIGFGGPEVPPSVCTTGCNDLTKNPDPTVLAGSDLHNSILAIPLRLGLPGLVVFLAFEVLVLARARRLGRRSGTMQWLLACHLLTGFTALTAVVLEGPYMGIFFWLFGGFVLGLSPAEHQDEHEADPIGSVRPAPAGL
jgi:O-antigen ligase